MEIKIEFYGVPLKVVGDYQPEEKEVLYYSDMSGYPGCASSFDIIEICAVDSVVDLSDLFSSADFNKIVELVIEKIER